MTLLTKLISSVVLNSVIAVCATLAQAQTNPDPGLAEQDSRAALSYSLYPVQDVKACKAADGSVHVNWRPVLLDLVQGYDIYDCSYSTLGRLAFAYGATSSEITIDSKDAAQFANNSDLTKICVVIVSQVEAHALNNQNQLSSPATLQTCSTK